jgi:hypothetical protein
MNQATKYANRKAKTLLPSPAKLDECLNKFLGCLLPLPPDAAIGMTFLSKC